MRCTSKYSVPIDAMFLILWLEKLGRELVLYYAIVSTGFLHRYMVLVGEHVPCLDLNCTGPRFLKFASMDFELRYQMAELEMFKLANPDVAKHVDIYHPLCLAAHPAEWNKYVPLLLPFPSEALQSNFNSHYFNVFRTLQRNIS